MSATRLAKGVTSVKTKSVKDLIQSLQDVNKNIRKGRPRKTGDKFYQSLRVDVVSERLCDDVIKYLAPTLEQHKGCTLLDLHPGPCLFSSKIHEYLKPKHHLLMEPEEQYFEPFIQPLLDKPGSTYRYSNLTFADLSSYADAHAQIEQDRSLLPSRPELTREDPKRRQLDPSVLIIGNLAKRFSTRGVHKNPTEHVPVLLRQLGYGTLTNEYQQKSGLVRMLLWAPERYKHLLTATLPYWRSAFNVGLDMGLDVSEVAGVQPLQEVISHRKENYTVRTRSHLLEDMNRQMVESRMVRAGFKVPKGREIQETVREDNSLKDNKRVQAAAVRLDNIMEDVARNAIARSPLAITLDGAGALRERLRATFAYLESISMWIIGRAPFVGEYEAALAKIEYPQVISVVRESRSTTITRTETSALLLDLSLRLLNIEANYKDLEGREAADGNTLDQLRKTVLALDEAFHKLMDSTPARTKQVVEDRTEDQLALFASTPLLSRDRRQYEPLQADSSEFYPQHDLVLYDMVPKSRDLSVPGLADSRKATNFCADLLKMLFTARQQALPGALDRVAVNAGKDLIPMVPAITDTRKGGRMNPNRLKVQMLSEEMAEGLVKAFFEWPFRPHTWEIGLDGGSQTTSEADNEDDHQEHD